MDCYTSSKFVDYDLRKTPSLDGDYYIAINANYTRNGTASYERIGNAIRITRLRIISSSTDIPWIAIVLDKAKNPTTPPIVTGKQIGRAHV